MRHYSTLPAAHLHTFADFIDHSIVYYTGCGEVDGFILYGPHSEDVRRRLHLRWQVGDGVLRYGWVR